MYQDTRCRIKFSNEFGSEFSSHCGVKQGDVLIPLLFSLFIDDLVTNLKFSVVIKNISVNSIYIFYNDIKSFQNA